MNRALGENLVLFLSTLFKGLPMVRSLFGYFCSVFVSNPLTSQSQNILRENTQYDFNDQLFIVII